MTDQEEKLRDIKRFCASKKIVLLGNSRKTLTTKKNIDGYGVVCRCNYGFPDIHVYNKKGGANSINKYQTFIGKRTDILFIAGNSPEDKATKIINPKFIVKTRISDTNTHPYCRENSYKFCEDKWSCLAVTENMSPTTGCLAIYFLVGLLKFKSLNIYGFDFYETSNWTNRPLNSAHSPEKEKIWIRHIIENNIKKNIMLEIE